jgi:hypothetical protein
MKNCLYIVAMMFLFLFTGRWEKLKVIFRWLIGGKLMIEEVDVEVVSENKFWRE